MRKIVRVVLTFLLAAALALGLAPSAGAADSQITVTAQGGYGGIVPRTGWAPIQVDVTNHGPDRTAILKLSTSGQGGFGGPFVKVSPAPGIAIPPPPPLLGGSSGLQVTQQLRVVLPAGTTKHFTAYLPATAGTWKAEVEATSGASLASAQTQVSGASSSLTIAVVSDDPTALNQIGAIQSLTEDFGGPPQLVHLTPGDLPDNPSALSGFGLVAFTNATTDSLTGAQRQALDEFVAQGGSVLVTGGAAWRSTQAGLPPDLVPMAPSGVQSVASLPGLAAYLFGNPPVPGSVDVATGTRRAGVTDLSEGQLPVLVESTVGRGLALYLTVDPTAEPLASWSGTLPLLRQVIIRGAVSQGPLGGGVGATIGRGVQGQGGSLFQALSNIPSLDLPSPVLIAIALVVFIVLVGPVNYVVLRRTHRPDLAWGTIPLLVVLSAGSIYGLGLKTRGTDVLADRIRVVYVDPSSGRGYVDSATGVFAPHAGTHSVSTVAGSLVTTLSAGGGFVSAPGGIIPLPFPFNPGATGSLTLDDHNPPDAQLSWPQADTIQAFGEEYAGSEQGGGLQAKLTVVNGRLTGTVVNRLGRPISDAVAMSGTAYHTFGAIPAGGSVSVDLPLSAPAPGGGNGGRNTLAQQIYLQAPAVCGVGLPCGVPISGARPSAQQREAQRRSEVLSGLMAGNPFSVSHPVLIAWSTSPAAPVRVDGQRAQLNELDAFVLPLQASSAGTSLAAGAVVARTVDATGAIPVLGSQVGPSFLQPNTDSVFEFALGSTGWTKLSLTEGAAFFGPPGVSTVSAAVYNFRTSTWDPITLTTSQSVDIPAPADHTSEDGLLRLRIRAAVVGLGPVGPPAFLGQIDISGEKGPTA